MRTLTLVLTAITTITSAVLAQQPVAPAPANCAPSGGLRFVCGQDGPEDLVEVPGTPWLVASAYGQQGGLFLIDTKAMTSRKIFPAGSVQERLDKKTYDTCPGPVSTTAKERFRTHGLFLQPGRGSHTLYVVYHGERESVEVFTLIVEPQGAAMTWVGCAVAPDPIGLNSVVALPEGGFAATNFDPRVGGRGGLSETLLSGKNNGEIWEWHTGKGWTKVPGSESAGANGIVLSPDAKSYYVSQWGNRSFFRLSRGEATPKRDQIPLGFRVDNVRWAPDGTLLVAGQGGTDDAIFGRGGAASVSTSVIGKIDPKTMTYKEIISHPTSANVPAATVAVQIGNEFWTGSFRGDRIVVYPVAGVK